MIDKYNTCNNKAVRFMDFKYLLKLLETKKMRFTRVDQLNDPLDNSSYLLPLPWHWSNNTTARKALYNNFKHLVKDKYVSCFSLNYKENESYLMWTHYAKNHTQLCFEVDFSNNSYLGNPSKVTYSDDMALVRKNLNFEIGELPEAKLIKHENDPSKVDLGLYVSTYKNSIWKYEQEVRLLITREHTGINNPYFKYSDDYKYVHVEFDPRIISKIIFGINAKVEDQYDVMEKCRITGISPIFEKMYINPITLNLDSKQLNY